MRCENCKKYNDVSYGSGRFCSEKCARSFSTKIKRDEINRKVSLSLGGTGEYRTFKCGYCEKKVKVTRSNRNNSKFCSHECSVKYRWRVYCLEVIKKGNFQVLGAKAENSVRKKAKRFIIEQNGHKCQLCGTETWQDKPVPLVLDHVDGNSDNNKITNCRVICRNCDGLLPTFAAKNKGKATHTRRMRSYRKRKVFNY